MSAPVAEDANHTHESAAPCRGTLIFDLDGTLVDSAPDLADALDALLAERGLPPLGLAAARKLIGHGISNLVVKAFNAVGFPLAEGDIKPAVDRFLHHYAKRLPRHAALYPDVAATLAALAAENWRMAVCTNKLEAYARKILEGLGIAHHFAVIAGPDTFGAAKPDPRHVLGTLSHPGQWAVLVGDSEVDIATAKAARLPVIAVTYGYAHTPLNHLAPDALVSRFADVPRAIASLKLPIEKDIPS